jgi:hypothetical protein
MPKLVVVVAKDDNGKLWDYVMTEGEENHCQNMFGTASGWVHKSHSSQDSPQCVPQTEPAEKDNVTFVVLPPAQEKRQRTKRTQTNATTK